MITFKQFQESQAGFSLVELSVVIFIIAIIMGAGLKFLTVQGEQAAYSSTKKKQETIKLALTSYFRAHKNLPCPDTRPGGGNTGAFSTSSVPDGIENRNSATSSPPDTTQICDGTFGILPYATLGLTRDVALDGWENFISYRVYYPSSGTVDDWVRSAYFYTGNQGAITVRDRYPATSSTATDQTTTAVAVIISHGKNGLGAYTVNGTRNALPNPTTLDEYQNTVGTGSHFARELSEDTSNTTYGVFDDMVVYVTSNDLLDTLYREGSITSPEAELAYELGQIRNKIIGYVMTDASCSTPPNLAAVGIVAGNSLYTDPWGTLYLYSEDLSRIEKDADAFNNAGAGVIEATHVAFSVRSYGPDRTVSTADDTVISMTPNDLAAIMGGAFMWSECP